MIRAALLALLVSSMVAPPLLARPVVRAEQTLTVRGVPETWQLVWTDQPGPWCGIDAIKDANGCSCEGFAYAEAGHMVLVRKRAGKEIERMALDPLFAAPGGNAADAMTVLARWPTDPADAKRAAAGDTGLAAAILRRPAVAAIRLGSYAGDGTATQFLLQIDTWYCGHRAYVAVGVTKQQPHLHALTSRAHPDRPLVMEGGAWAALAHGPGQHVSTQLACGEYGSETQTDLVVSAANGQIAVKKRTYQCHDHTEVGAMTSEIDE
jgi:hypothetical protein